MEQTENKLTDKVLDKIKKMLFKAQEGSGASEAEAQSCMLRAQELMAKHNLTVEDVGVEAVHIEKKVVERKVGQKTKLQWWQKDLANVIAKNFRCFTFWNTWNGTSQLKFLGLEDDASLACEMFNFANRAVEHLSILFLDREEYHGLSVRTKARNAWIQGFIAGLGEKFREQVASKGWLMIIQPDVAVVEAHDKKKITHEKGSTEFSQLNNNSRLYAQMQGFEEGKRLDKNSNAITEKASGGGLR